jgi:hypothetical protein
MRAAADVVVVDSPPALKAPDVITLASVSDLAVLVADVRRTCRADVRATAQQVREAGQHSVAGIVNRVRQPFTIGSLRRVRQKRVSLAPQASVPAILASSVPPRGPNGQGEVPLSGVQAGGDHRRPDAVTGP